MLSKPDQIAAIYKSSKLIWILTLTTILSACGSDNNEPDTDTNSPDITPPEIRLIGDASLEVEVGSSFIDAGASASDNIDGDISANVTVSGNVDTDILGTYTLTYSVSDSSGNNADALTRTIIIVDTTPPVISLIGDASISLEVGTTYTDNGATANDSVDGDVSVNIVSTGMVDSNTVGSYIIMYNVADASGNDATTISRMVNVVDTSPPIISLNGGANFTVELGTSYSEPGASALDNLDGDISDNIRISGLVDVDMIGVYTLTYEVIDSSRNEATPVVRNVTVVDTSAPLLVSTSPTASQTDVVTDVIVTAVLNEPLIPGSVRTDTVLVIDESGMEVSGTVLLNSDHDTITFIPEAALLENTEYTVTLLQSISDVSMNTLVSDLSWEFTTLTTDDSTLPVSINTIIPGKPAFDPQLVMNASGAAIAAWMQDEVISINRYDPAGGWQGVEVVSVATDVAKVDMKVAINDNGDAVVVWTKVDFDSFGTASSIFVNNYSSATGWSGPQSIDGLSSGISEMANVGIDALGNSIVIWRHRTSFQADGEIYVRRYDAVNDTWEDSVKLFQQSDDTTADNAVSPDIAVNPQGQAMAIWEVGGYEIRVGYYDPSTGWADYVNIADAPDTNGKSLPAVSIDENANVVAIWRQRLTPNSNPDIYARRFTINDGWSSAVALETNQFGEASYPQIVMNGTHTVALWTESDGVTRSLYTNVLNPDNTWEGVRLNESLDRPVFRNDTGGTSIAINAAGKVVIAWNQDLLIAETGANEGRIYISERELDTSSTWTSPKPLLQTGLTTEAFAPSVGIASDGTGIVISKRIFGNTVDIQSHQID